MLFYVLEIEKCETEPSSKVSSRPQTPKSAHSSASRNPKVSSRPNTPSKPAPVAKTTPSRPHTPRQSALPRPKNTTALKSHVRPKPQPKKQVVNDNQDPNDISAVFVTKQEEFHRLKKELDLKQVTNNNFKTTIKCSAIVISNNLNEIYFSTAASHIGDIQQSAKFTGPYDKGRQIWRRRGFEPTGADDLQRGGLGGHRSCTVGAQL